MKKSSKTSIAILSGIFACAFIWMFTLISSEALRSPEAHRCRLKAQAIEENYPPRVITKIDSPRNHRSYLLINFEDGTSKYFPRWIFHKHQASTVPGATLSKVSGVSYMKLQIDGRVDTVFMGYGCPD